MDVYSWFRRSLSRTTKTTTTTVTAQPDDELLYGVSDQLVDFIKSFSIDTFRNFSLPNEDDGDTPENVRRDLSDWQQRHALLFLAISERPVLVSSACMYSLPTSCYTPELSQLRFKLCPRFLKDHQFWTIYFALVKDFVAKYELRAIQLDKLKQMRLESENSPDVAACEVEMSEAKRTTDVSPTISEDHN
uniref:BSD domain-containing protein n=1 Tax=Solanum lycopersicum TaxID=4081 RepID=A0A3Q7I2J0_SOLLC